MMGEDDVDDMSEGSFNSKSVWARMSVVVAGAVFNFLLALIFSMIVIGYTGYDEPVISGVVEGFPAQEAGLTEGDRIVKMNNKKAIIFDFGGVLIDLDIEGCKAAKMDGIVFDGDVNHLRHELARRGVDVETTFPFFTAMTIYL